jgi:hypothetical protein
VAPPRVEGSGAIDLAASSAVTGRWCIRRGLQERAHLAFGGDTDRGRCGAGLGCSQSLGHGGGTVGKGQPYAGAAADDEYVFGRHNGER